jgi:OPA family glycerol-3-phosphate transporter-like MFS transporter 3
MPSSAAPRPCCRPRPLVFTLTFFSYGVFHVGRKSFSTIKPILEQESFFVDGGSLSQNEMLGLLDTLFLGFYSAGLYMSGSLADRVNPRHVIAFGLLGSAFLSVLFGLGGVMNCRALPLYATIWGLNGLVQSTGWPANVSVMGAWFPSSRGTLFGLWSANISGGNILGTAVILLLLQVCGDSAGWRVSMFVIGAIMAVQAALVLMLLQPRPEPSSPARAPDAEAGSATLLDPAARLAAAGGPETSGGRSSAHPSACTNATATDEPRPEAAERAISFAAALKIPGVTPYALCYACLKGVNVCALLLAPRLPGRLHGNERDRRRSLLDALRRGPTHRSNGGGRGDRPHDLSRAAHPRPL